MLLFLRGQWTDKPHKIEVKNPYDGSVIDTVPKATAEDTAKAIEGAIEGARIMRAMPGYKRWEILSKAAQLMRQRQEELGRTISLEEGKILKEGIFEASRAVETIQCSAEEAKRIGGEVLPLDGAPGGETKFGFTLRVPCGIVVAITPFNFPLNLVCHKVGPALAAGNAVIVKPASDTPLSALKLVEILLEAGLPPLAIACLTGAGGEIGDELVKHPGVRKVSFTGSRDVGEHLVRTAGVKKVTLELGSNSPLIVMDDADLEKVAAATVATGYSNAGQVCISTQRVIADQRIYDEFLGALVPQVEALTTGNQLEEGTKMGPMIREKDAERVRAWVDEAGGARLLTGGGRRGSLLQPSVLADVTPDMRVSRDEVFGPTVAVTRADDIDHAIALANDTRYGLSAAIFTQDIDRALKFARQVDAGCLHINWGPQWRTDLMPYGGLKDSGFGKEGPKYAVREMTEEKTVIIHGT